MKDIRSFTIGLVLALVLLVLGACGPAEIQPGSGGLTGRTPGSETGAGPEQATQEAATATAVFAACMEATPAPLGLSIAESFEVPHNQILTWFCDGYSYENIMIALETHAATGVPVDTLLKMLLTQEWEEIWEKVGFDGK